jgi:ribonuclease BN (tRNA processing enzyme)
MFDCGPATTHKLVKAGLFPTQIDHLFITHHHYDHIVDLPCFILCRWDQGAGKINQLQVWGPPPTEWFYERLLGPDGAFSYDVEARVKAPGSQAVHVNRGGSLPRPKPSVKVTNVKPGIVTEQQNWKVTAAQVHHAEPWLQSLAYRVDSTQGSIVFAGDSAPCASLYALASGADVLVLHVWDHQNALDKSGEGPGEMGTLNAAETAQACNVKTLIVNHSTPALTKPGSRERGIGAIARIFNGDIIFAEELIQLSL